MVFHCPSNTLKKDSVLTSSGYYTSTAKEVLCSYGWNYNGTGNTTDQPWRAGMGYILSSDPRGGCAKTSNTSPDTIIVTDGRDTGVTYIAWNYVQPLHSNGANFLFLDGHAKKLSYAFYHQVVDDVMKLWTRRKDSSGIIE